MRSVALARLAGIFGTALSLCSCSTSDSTAPAAPPCDCPSEEYRFPGTPAACVGDVYVYVPVPSSYRQTFPCANAYAFCVPLAGQPDAGRAFYEAACLDAPPDAIWRPYDDGAGIPETQDAGDSGPTVSLSCSTGGTEATCIAYKDVPASEAPSLAAACDASRGTTCPSSLDASPLGGCCTLVPTGGYATEQCYYGQIASVLATSAGCANGGGVYSAVP
jgi:hypothetical protein